MTITSKQLKQANKIFLERDYYFTLDSLNKGIISKQQEVISLDSVAICRLDSCVQEDYNKIEKLTTEVNYATKIAKRRGWIVAGFSLLYLCLLALS